jgi:histidine triad (HIT) family protein
MSNPSDDCIFCRIVQGKAAADKVYEDGLVVCFWDAKPVRPVHILIVPRRHIPTLNDVGPDDEIIAHMSRVAVKVAEQFEVAESGYRIFVNVNRGGGQVVFHLHMHLIAKKGESE